MKTVLRLLDGTEISSGDPAKNAVRSLKLTKKVNEGQELTPGSCCAAMAEIDLILSESDSPIRAGDELEVMQQGEGRVLMGLFTAEKPEQTGRLCRITAYDRITRLDRDLTQWLSGLTKWPYPLQAFTQMVCRECGTELDCGAMLNKNFPVQKFFCGGITGRQLMRWAGELSCCFCTASPSGKLLMQWYTPPARQILPDGPLYYYQDSLKLTDYQVKPVEKVQIQRDSTDIGVLWPDSPEAKNTFQITGNYLTFGAEKELLRDAASQICTRLAKLSYTPCSLSVPFWSDLTPGSGVFVTAPGGKKIETLIMERVQEGFRARISCTGSPERSSVSAVNHRSYQNLSGRVLHLQTDMDGIRAENSDMQGKVSALQMDVEGIQTTVTAGAQRTDKTLEQLQQNQTQLQQDAEKLSLQVQTIRQDGVQKVITETGYQFDSDGLRISKSGQEIANRMDNTGMYVERSGAPVLTANAAGVQATDLQARNYLIIGDNARFEDYSDGNDLRRTACFHI